MNNQMPIEQAQGPSKAGSGIGWRQVLRFVAYVLALSVVLFVSSGHLDWGMAWVYAGMTIFCTILSRAIALKKHPDLLVERGRSMDAEDAARGDKALVLFAATIGPLVTLVVAGLDRRFGWSPRLALPLQLAALALALLGYLVGTWAMAVNRFFSAVVRIQKERGHTVVNSGPYRIVRHPAYAGGVVAHLAVPLMLGSLWALIPAVLTAALVVVRTALEDRTLLEKLDGYVDYARQVRYRLIPGLW
jgi:protein-S-isoprenylcysteine O-methyltransferase Ste14